MKEKMKYLWRQRCLAQHRESSTSLSQRRPRLHCSPSCNGSYLHTLTRTKLDQLPSPFLYSLFRFHQQRGILSHLLYHSSIPGDLIIQVMRCVVSKDLYRCYLYYHLGSCLYKKMVLWNFRVRDFPPQVNQPKLKAKDAIFVSGVGVFYMVGGSYRLSSNILAQHRYRLRITSPSSSPSPVPLL
jgi:hypothetical protein